MVRARWEAWHGRETARGPGLTGLGHLRTGARGRRMTSHALGAARRRLADSRSPSRWRRCAAGRAAGRRIGRRALLMGAAAMTIPCRIVVARAAVAGTAAAGTYRSRAGCARADPWAFACSASAGQRLRPTTTCARERGSSPPAPRCTQGVGPVRSSRDRASRGVGCGYGRGVCSAPAIVEGAAARSLPVLLLLRRRLLPVRRLLLPGLLHGCAEERLASAHSPTFCRATCHAARFAARARAQNRLSIPSRSGRTPEIR